MLDAVSCLEKKVCAKIFDLFQGSEMRREFSGWGVISAGALLSLVGVYWLFAGWEHIQIERGWSQFIAGSTALSSGVVTMAIGRLIRLLVSDPRPGAIAPTPAVSRQTVTTPSVKPVLRGSDPQQASLQQRQARPPAPMVKNEPVRFDEPTLQKGVATDQEAVAAPIRSHAWDPTVSETETAPEEDDWRHPVTHAPGAGEPKEVDRYSAGDATYVMYSDGSVEVRTPGEVRLYESLEALRANSAER